MKQLVAALVVALLQLSVADLAWSQTADEIVEKSIAALGGRAAHAKLQSRSATGTIVLATPGGDITGSIDVLSAAPNRTRMLIQADLSALGAGPLTVDQRFNGETGYVLDSLQGNRELTAGQLAGMKNGAFPHPFLDYKARGMKVTLGEKEKVGDRAAHVVTFTPADGPATRQYIDAETFLPVKMTTKVEIPQLGQEVEQTTVFSDYKAVDGVMVPFRLASSSSVQNFTVTISKVEHNVKVDEALFSKPAGR